MYAISTPIDDQYAGDGIAVRGVAYGMPSIRVDGNDIFAIYSACQKGREIIIKEKRPVLIEAISFRVGDHSTSDFSQRYRDTKEMEKWKDLLAKFSSPIVRLEKYMLRKKLIKEDDSQKIREVARQKVRDSLKAAIETKKPSVDELFSDVFEQLPKGLQEQKEELKEHLRKYKDEYELSLFNESEKFLK